MPARRENCVKAIYRCWAEIDLDALRENLSWIRHRVGPGVKIMTVVKADAYGHGLKQIAALLMQSGTDVFGVANLAEARILHNVGRGWPVLLLGACLPTETEAAVADGVAVTVSSLAEARRFSRAARRLRKTARVHVKVDTGMGRLGIPAEAAAELVRRLARFPGLEIEGIYTHYSSVEDDPAFSRSQRTRFERFLKDLDLRRVQVRWIHANNSGGLLHEPGTVFNLVRPGLLVYGVPPPGRRPVRAPWLRRLRPALSFHCRVGFVKAVPPGTPLSYGRAFVASRRMKVATLTAGYGDGYLRAAGNRARVLIRGRRCRVVGRVTMDQMMVDVTRVKGVKAGDEAVLIGRQGRHTITASDLAGWCGTVPWDVLTAISNRVPRLYRGSQAA